MNKTRRCAAMAGILLASMLLTARPDVAAVTLAAHLQNGETTQDGKLTLLVRMTVAGANIVVLRNNDSHTIVIDRFALTPARSRSCTGEHVAIGPHAQALVCFVTVEPAPVPSPLASGPFARPLQTLDPSAGSARLQMDLRWHRLQVPQPVASPTATPT